MRKRKRINWFDQFLSLTSDSKNSSFRKPKRAKTLLARRKLDLPTLMNTPLQLPSARRKVRLLAPHSQEFIDLFLLQIFTVNCREVTVRNMSKPLGTLGGKSKVFSVRNITLIILPPVLADHAKTSSWSFHHPTSQAISIWVTRSCAPLKIHSLGGIVCAAKQFSGYLGVITRVLPRKSSSRRN